MVCKDVAIINQWFQYIMLHIHQYSVYILYKPGPELYIVGWLSWNNYEECRDQEITGKNVILPAISAVVDIPICTSIEDLQGATSQDLDLQRLKAYIIRGWTHTKDEMQHIIQKCWPIRHELVMIDGIAMKGKLIIIPYILQNLILEHPWSNHWS